MLFSGVRQLTRSHLTSGVLDLSVTLVVAFADLLSWLAMAFDNGKSSRLASWASAGLRVSSPEIFGILSVDPPSATLLLGG